MSEHLDVVIVGAGISGISAAWHLQDRCPGKSYAILERRDNLGGTWDLFKYPGIRSDSDMFTLGFRFKPWTSEKSIADGPSIMSLPEGDGRGVRHRQAHPVQPEGSSPRIGPTTRTVWKIRVDRGGEEAEITALVPVRCQRLLQLRRRLHAGVRRVRRLRGHRSFIRSTGRRTLTTQARRSSSSAVVPPQ